MTDYRVTVKVRNARLLRAIENAGYTSIPKFANDAGVSYESLNRLVNMTAAPIYKGKISPVVQKIIDYLCEPFESLFSEAQMDALLTNKTEREMSAEQVYALANDDATLDPLLIQCRKDELECREYFDCLNEREKTFMRARFGFDGDPQTLNDLAEAMGISAGRAYQIEAKALRKIRSRLHHMKVHGLEFA